jgi:alkanesulfonate monooxygenase SsuD/methylene tetrahydromethanopterin reductase-like flavin-dependent oxidoreductase (luciferase family)
LEFSMLFEAQLAVFLAGVAARTSRIRMGHAAVCMPCAYNAPAPVAERAAMLDVLSNVCPIQIDASD